MTVNSLNLKERKKLFDSSHQTRHEGKKDTVDTISHLYERKTTKRLTT